MTHSDDSGLILPPAIAPIQVILIPIPGAGEAAQKFALEQKHKLVAMGIRVKCDDKEGESAGFKFNKWEVKGVPVRLEIGDKEQKEGVVTMLRRDTMEKSKVQVEEVAAVLASMQKALLARHKKFTEEHTHIVDSYDEFKRIMAGERGFIRSFWCEDKACEDKIKRETKATTRCLPLDAKVEKGSCIGCGKNATHRWLFGQSY